MTQDTYLTPNRYLRVDFPVHKWCRYQTIQQYIFSTPEPTIVVVGTDNRHSSCREAINHHQSPNIKHQPSTFRNPSRGCGISYICHQTYCTVHTYFSYSRSIARGPPIGSHGGHGNRRLWCAKRVLHLSPQGSALPKPANQN